MRLFVSILAAAAVLPIAQGVSAQAQNPPAAQAQQPSTPAQTQPAPQAAALKLSFDTPAGMLLVPIKPDKTADFEEMISKIRSGLAKTDDATLKQQAPTFKVFKGASAADRVMYVVFVEPAVAKAEYDLFMLLQKVMTKEELSDTAKTTALWEKYRNAFVSGYNIWPLTPIGGVQ